VEAAWTRRLTSTAQSVSDLYPFGHCQLKSLTTISVLGEQQKAHGMPANQQTNQKIMDGVRLECEAESLDLY